MRGWSGGVPVSLSEMKFDCSLEELLDATEAKRPRRATTDGIHREGLTEGSRVETEHRAFRRVAGLGYKRSLWTQITISSSDQR